jgi:hypothetical protein
MRREARRRANKAARLMASLVKAAPKPKPRHKWQDVADLICAADGIMETTASSFTVTLPDGRRVVNVEGGWSEEHYTFLKSYLSTLSEPQLNMARIAHVVLANRLRQRGCQEPETAFWVLCKKHGFDEEEWLPQRVESKGFPAIIREMEEALGAYRKTNPRRPLKIALMEHPHFDGKFLCWGNRRWSFRKQNGPVQMLLTALEGSGWRSVTVAPPGQTHLAPHQVRLDPDAVREAGKSLRKKTMPHLNWHASNDGMFGWSVP